MARLSMCNQNEHELEYADIYVGFRVRNHNQNKLFT